MDIGKNIVRLRNEKGYTQEMLASLLHVSSAAVSKWEHGSSCPDISTLPILARIFDISIDELLNFEKNLSEEQVNRLCEEMLGQFQSAPFPEAMAYVKKVLRQYPNSESLKLSFARLSMQVLLLLQEEGQANEFLALAKQLAQEVSQSADLEKKQLAGILLVNFLAMEQRYEEGLQLLQKLPRLADTSSLEGTLAMQIKDEDEAMHMLQAQLFSHYHQIGMILLNMCNLAKRNNRMDMLRSYLQLMEGLSHLFQLPLSVMSQLYIYSAALHVGAATLRYVKEYIEQLKSMDNLQKQRQMQLHDIPWFDHVELNAQGLSKGIMQTHIKDMLEDMAQSSILSFDSVQQLLKEEIALLRKE